MTITSHGYFGDIDEVVLASIWAQFLGHSPCVATSADWKVTTVSGVDRTVRIATGTGYGYGVADVSDATVDVQLDTLSSGTTRWDAIVARRNWQPVGGTTSFVAVKGTSTKAVPTLSTSPGVQADQLLALVQVTGGTQVPTALIDCRMGLDGGALDRAGADFLGVRMTDDAAWTNVTLKTGFTLAPTSLLAGPQTPAVRYRGGRVMMRGAVVPTSGAFTNGGTLICDTLPVKYRPDRVVPLSLACDTRAGYTTVRGQVDQLGGVSVYVPTGVSDFPRWISLEASYAPSTTY